MSVYVAIYNQKQIAKGEEARVIARARSYIRGEIDAGRIQVDDIKSTKVAIHRYDHCYNLTFSFMEGDDRPVAEDRHA